MLLKLSLHPSSFILHPSNDASPHGRASASDVQCVRLDSSVAAAKRGGLAGGAVMSACDSSRLAPRERAKMSAASRRSRCWRASYSPREAEESAIAPKSDGPAVMGGLAGVRVA